MNGFHALCVRNPGYPPLCALSLSTTRGEAMARPAGPLRKYSVQCIWPTVPGKWRSAVEDADEVTARNSTLALKRMHYPVRVSITFLTPNKARQILSTHLACEWDRCGRILVRYSGAKTKDMPEWALGREDLVRK